MDTVPKASRQRVLAAYDAFLTACTISKLPRSRAYALGVLSGTLQGERGTLQRYLERGKICWTEREYLTEHLAKVDEILAACSKLYINNEV